MLTLESTCILGTWIMGLYYQTHFLLLAVIILLISSSEHFFNIVMMSLSILKTKQSHTQLSGKLFQNCSFFVPFICNHWSFSNTLYKGLLKANVMGNWLPLLWTTCRKFYFISKTFFTFQQHMCLQWLPAQDKMEQFWDLLFSTVQPKGGIHDDTIILCKLCHA